MAIHKILSSLVALTLVGNGLSIPTYTDITVEPLTRDDVIDHNVLEKRIQEIIIGYRRVDPAEAELYKNAGNTLTPSSGKGGLQLGQGVYTSDELGSWKGDGKKPTKNCVILANAEAFEKIPKAWIPRPNWWSAPLNMRPEKYLKGLSLDPAKTIRMGIVDLKGEETLQMMIPNELLNDKGGGLDLVVNCEDPEKKLELPTHKVDYSKWANVVGEKFAPVELEIQKLQEPADQLVKDSDAARVEAESAASVKDVEAASEKAETALKALQDIAQQMVQYTVKYNEWLYIENNLKPFSLYNQARANLLSTALRADEKTVEDYKVKFDEAVKEPITGNEAITQAEKLAADIKQVAEKVQKDLTALKAKGDSTPPLELGKLARQDVTELKKLEAKVVESEVSATEKSLTKLSDIQKQVEAQLEKLPSPPETDPGNEDKDKGNQDKEDKDKNKETDNGNKETDKGQEGDKETDKGQEGDKEKDTGKDTDKEKDTGKDTDKEKDTGSKDTGSKDPGSSPSEQSTEESKKAIQERTKIAQDLEKSSGSGWVGKALGGLAATAGTLVGAGGLYIAATGTAGAGGAVGVGGAALTGSLAVGEVTISGAVVSQQVSAAEVAEVLREVVPEYAEKALNTVRTLRPVKLPKTPVRIPVLARKRQDEAESPELKRWRVAAVALLANQAIKDSLLEAFNQAQKEMASK